MSEDLFLVFSNPTEGHEDAYNQWYDRTHLADVLSVPGVVAARRYELAPMTPEAEGVEVTPPAHRYLAVYELDRDPDEVMGEFLRRVGSGEMVLDDALDLAGVSMATWRPRGTRQQAPAVKGTSQQGA